MENDILGTRIKLALPVRKRNWVKVKSQSRDLNPVPSKMVDLLTLALVYKTIVLISDLLEGLVILI